MALDRMLYRLTYRLGAPRWDTGMPQPELEQLVPGRPPGRVLDLGSGPAAQVERPARHELFQLRLRLAGVPPRCAKAVGEPVQHPIQCHGSLLSD